MPVVFVARHGKRLLLDLYGEEDEAALGPWTPYMAAEVRTTEPTFRA
jgi:hypothetical protein